MKAKPVSLFRLKELIQAGFLAIVNVSSEVKPKYADFLKKEYISCEEFIAKMQFEKWLYEITSGVPVDVSYEIVGTNVMKVEVGRRCPYMETIYFADCVLHGISVEDLHKKLAFGREDLFEEIKKSKWW